MLYEQQPRKQDFSSPYSLSMAKLIESLIFRDSFSSIAMVFMVAGIETIQRRRVSSQHIGQSKGLSFSSRPFSRLTEHAIGILSAQKLGCIQYPHRVLTWD